MSQLLKRHRVQCSLRTEWCDSHKGTGLSFKFTTSYERGYAAYCSSSSDFDMDVLGLVVD